MWQHPYQVPAPIPHEELDRELFQIFENGSGVIQMSDLENIGRAMGWQRE